MSEFEQVLAAFHDVATGEVVDLGEGALPQWSPDGRHIAYVIASAGALDVFTMDADGGTEFNVTKGEGSPHSRSGWATTTSCSSSHARRRAESS